MTETASSWYIPLDKKKGLTLGEITLFAVLGAMTFAAKMAMALLPNIEPVSLMVMVFVAVFGRKGLYPVYVYVMMEVLWFGLGTWNINYLYIWTILAVAAMLMRGSRNRLSWAILSGAFGLLFGALCAPVDVVIGGLGFAVTKWASGILFDVTHCAGNFVIALLLFEPLRTLLTGLYGKMMVKA